LAWLNSCAVGSEIYYDEWFQLIHGKHEDDVYVCTKNPIWDEDKIEHSTASIQDYSFVKNTFMTMNGISCNEDARRSNISAITSFYLDLDYYKDSALSNLTPFELFDLITQRETWLPAPTMLVNSGQGAYLIWTFSTIPHMKHRGTWERAKSHLIELLREYATDHAVKDLARVLRIPGTINDKTGNMVEAYRTGEPVDFYRMVELIESRYREKFPPTPIGYAKPAPRETPAKNNSVGKVRWTHFKLWNERLKDLESIAEHRGRLTDCRERFMFIYATGLAWLESDPFARRRRLTAFARMHFADSSDIEKYITATKSNWLGLNGKVKRYRLSNKAIIEQLQITESELVLCTTIGSVSDEPLESKAERAARVAARRAQVQMLRCQGYSAGMIAERTGTALSTVKKDFRILQSCVDVTDTLSLY
jgi:hypothetical protein